MSEQNILNPANTSFLNPAFGYDDELQTVLQEFTSDSGRYSSRLGSGMGRTFNLQWKGIPDASAAALRQWEVQYRQGFFSIADYDRARYFTGHFKGPLTYTNAGNQNKNVTAVFEELCGLPMFQYPSNWAVDAMMLEETSDFGQPNVKLVGTWAINTTDAPFSGGAAYKSSTVGDTAEWIYFGYGFRFFSIKSAISGSVLLSCTRVADGTVMLAPTVVGLWNSGGTLAAAPLFTQANYPLDFYRVKIELNGTDPAQIGGADHNISYADALQVMQ